MTADLPDAVRDADGDIWTHRADGEYAFNHGGYLNTLESIHEQFGPLTVLAIAEAGEWNPPDPYETRHGVVMRYEPPARRWEQWRRIAGENVYICSHHTDRDELLQRTLPELREDPRQDLYVLREINDDGQPITPDPLPEWVLGLVRAAAALKVLRHGEEGWRVPDALARAIDAVPQEVRDAASGGDGE